MLTYGQAGTNGHPDGCGAAVDRVVFLLLNLNVEKFGYYVLNI